MWCVVLWSFLDYPCASHMGLHICKPCTAIVQGLHECCQSRCACMQGLHTWAEFAICLSLVRVHVLSRDHAAPGDSVLVRSKVVAVANQPSCCLAEARLQGRYSCHDGSTECVRFAGSVLMAWLGLFWL